MLLSTCDMRRQKIKIYAPKLYSKTRQRQRGNLNLGSLKFICRCRILNHALSPEINKVLVICMKNAANINLNFKKVI